MSRKSNICKTSAVRSNNNDYEVGYGKPPKDTRFRKGQSGNPKGRPRKRKSSTDILLDVLSSQITVKEGDEHNRIDQRTALFKSIVARAIKGDMRAASIVLRLLESPNVAASEIPKVTKIIRKIVSPRERE